MDCGLKSGLLKRTINEVEEEGNSRRNSKGFPYVIKLAASNVTLKMRNQKLTECKSKKL